MNISIYFLTSLCRGDSFTFFDICYFQQHISFLEEYRRFRAALLFASWVSRYDFAMPWLRRDAAHMVLNERLRHAFPLAMILFSRAVAADIAHRDVIFRDCFTLSPCFLYMPLRKVRAYHRGAWWLDAIHHFRLLFRVSLSLSAQLYSLLPWGWRSKSPRHFTHHFDDTMMTLLSPPL